MRTKQQLPSTVQLFERISDNIETIEVHGMNQKQWIDGDGDNDEDGGDDDDNDDGDYEWMLCIRCSCTM